MRILLFEIFFAWLAIGVAMVYATKSRGLWADALFLFVWPIHVVRHLMGKE